MKYRKKPVVIEAIQWTGLNLEEIKEFVGKDLEYSLIDTAWEVGKGAPHVIMKIHTLEGDHECTKGDFIIKGANGEFYPCKPDIFAKTYEAASAGIENPKIMIVSDGDITILHLNGEHVRGESVDFLFHADVDYGRIVRFDGVIQKKDENGHPVIENDEVARQKFHYDSRESQEIQFEEVK